MTKHITQVLHMHEIMNEVVAKMLLESSTTVKKINYAK
jgi:hypothetical protein